MRYKILIIAIALLTLPLSAQSFQSRWSIYTPSSIFGMLFSHSEKFIVARAGNDSSYIIDALSGSLRGALPGNNPFGISQDDAYLYHYSNPDSTFVKLNIATGELTQKMQKDAKSSWLDASAVSSDCKYGIAYYSKMTVPNKTSGWRVWNLSTGKIVLDHSYVTDPKGLVQASAGQYLFLSDSNVVLVSESKGYYNNGGPLKYTHNIVLYDIKTGDSISAIPDNTLGFALSNDGKSYISTNLSKDTGGIIVYDLSSRVEKVRMAIPGISIYGQVIFSPNDDYLLAPSNDSIFYLCRVQDGKMMYNPGYGGCEGLCVNKDVTLIVGYSANNVVAIVPPILAGVSTSEKDNIDVLYPNPTNWTVSVLCSTPCSDASIVRATNMRGEVYDLQYYCRDNNAWVIDLSILRADQYILTLLQAGSLKKYKLQVTR